MEGRRYMLVRHGESQANVVSDISRTTDPRLTDAMLTEPGVEQARAMGLQLAKLHDFPVDLIIVSPFSRAIQTACLIAETWDKSIPMEVHADVREYYPLFLPEIIGRTARWLRMCPQLGTLTTAVYWLLAAGCWLLRTFLPLINPMTRKDTAQASTKYICTTSASLERFKDLDFSAVPEGDWWAPSGNAERDQTDVTARQREFADFVSNKLSNRNARNILIVAHGNSLLSSMRMPILLRGVQQEHLERRWRNCEARLCEWHSPQLVHQLMPSPAASEPATAEDAGFVMIAEPLLPMHKGAESKL